MTETKTEFALTKDQVRALRTADHICFDHCQKRDEHSSGIRAIKVGPPPWREETTLRIPTMSSVFIHSEAKEIDYDTRHGLYARCFELIYSYNEEWQTIAGLLKAGDEIELRWVGSDDNGYLRRSRVTERDNTFSSSLGEPCHHDKLYVHIRRGGKRKYSFYLADQICPDNSARMIKPSGSWV